MTTGDDGGRSVRGGVPDGLRKTERAATTQAMEAGLGIAVVALVLSVFNTWKQWDRDRVKLRVKPAVETWGEGLGEATVVFTIEVANLSNFAITIAKAGILFRNHEPPPISFDQTIEREGDVISIPLPIRVEPRAAVSLTSSALPAKTIMLGPRGAYVTTACGVTKTSKIRATRQ